MDNDLMNSAKGMFTRCIDGHKSPSMGGRYTLAAGSDRRESNQGDESDAPLFLLDQIIDLVQAFIFDPAASSAVIHLGRPHNGIVAGLRAPLRQQMYFNMPVLDLGPFGLLTCVFHAAFFHPPVSNLYVPRI
ncbi:hypothetical protein K438DRAFT_1768284 [Mycena galopus ATCC 62051]|nr:hypothetical protein K438DRAFT_1768284 [Mycena galopus ATCC 62051]